MSFQWAPLAWYINENLLITKKILNWDWPHTASVDLHTGQQSKLRLYYHPDPSWDVSVWYFSCGWWSHCGVLGCPGLPHPHGLCNQVSVQSSKMTTSSSNSMTLLRSRSTIPWYKYFLNLELFRTMQIINILELYSK